MVKAGMSKKQEFINNFRQSLAGETFIKISFGNYKGSEDLKKIHAKKILIKNEEKFSITYQYKTRDIVKNFAVEEAFDKLVSFIGDNFHAVTLWTTAFDLTYDISGNKDFLKKSAPAKEKEVSLKHDRDKKKYISSQGKKYLFDLGITDQNGAVFKNAQDKYRQINKYIEIIESLIKNIDTVKTLHIVDMGSGKGYLTFALYDYLLNTLKIHPKITGVEYRQDMVDLCNKIAENSGFGGLKFVQGTIDGYTNENIDMLIALHACDTATDDAISKGIAAGAELIVVAPCCHKQVRREIEKSRHDNDLGFLTRFGIFMERQAEMATDGIRALILEYSGYSTKVFEFISDAHTAKNVMIVATKNDRVKKNDPKILERINQAKAFYGIERHYLEKAIGQ